MSPAADLIVERLTAQLLSAPDATDPVAVVDRLLAVQAQDGRGARLAIRARSTGLNAADVDRALTDDRSLVIGWLNRGTLHLVRADDYRWLHALTAPQLATSIARRLKQEGVTPRAAERGVRTLVRALTNEGPLTRLELGHRVASVGTPVAGQALIHVLALASLRGHIVRGPMIGRQHAYVLARDWLPPTRAPTREQALAELARRYLAGHAPADDRDLAKWAGITLSDARAGLRAIAHLLEDAPDGRVRLAGSPTPRPLPPPRLLGAFDPVLMGWTSRQPILGAHGSTVVTGGLFRPFVLVRGRGVATWGLHNGEVTIEPFAPLSGPDARAVRTEGDRVLSYLALPSARQRLR